MIIWHYTTGKKFESIVRDGLIMPAIAGVEQRERPIVWFSENQVWEETANKLRRDREGRLIPLDKKQTHELGRGLVRIGVSEETAPHRWPALKRLGRISSKTAARLVRAAYRDGADPMQWRGTFDPVPRSLWVAVEVLENDEWVPVPVASNGEPKK